MEYVWEIVLTVLCLMGLGLLVWCLMGGWCARPRAGGLPSWRGRGTEGGWSRASAP